MRNRPDDRFWFLDIGRLPAWVQGSIVLPSMAALLYLWAEPQLLMTWPWVLRLCVEVLAIIGALLIMVVQVHHLCHLMTDDPRA